MTVLPNMGLTLPVRGAPGSGLWGDTLDADLALTDAHDHSPGKGALVPTAGIGINADLSFASLYAAKDLQRITFASVAALAANNKSLFVNVADNELYWRNNVGTNVKMTLNNALNVAAFAGGIGGDYTAVSAAEAFDDANKRYTFKDGSAHWARLASGEVRIQPTGGTGTFFVGLAAPGALAGSYTATWPLVLPAVKGLLAIDSTGTMTTTPTLPAGIRLMQIDNAGAVTTPAAALPSTIAQVMISSAGVITYQPGPYMWHASAAQPNGIGVPTYDGTQWALGAGTTLSCPIVLPVGSSFTTWKIYLNKSSSGAGTCSVSLREINMLTHSVSSIGAAQTNNVNAPGDIQLSGAGTTILADRSYWLNFSCSGASGDFLYGWSALP